MKISVVALLALFLISGRAISQCCTAGNPSGSSQSVQSLEDNSLNISLFHTYSYSDTYFNGYKKLDKQYMESYLNFSSLSVSYQWSQDLRITAEIGFFENKAQQFIDDDYLRYSDGLGDLNLGANYVLYSGLDFNVKQTLVVTLPIGNFNQEYDGVILPIDLQPSSGNAKVKLGLSYDHSFFDTPFFIMVSTSAEMSQMLETDNSFHKYGNLYDLAFLLNYHFDIGLSLGFNSRIEYREKALSGSKSVNNTYSYINATGGVIAFLSPRLTYNLPFGIGLVLQYNQPIYKNVNSEQLTNKYSFIAGISRSFSL